uniref:Uncharacterized protein n=1 Tax=Timema bartmani TaxID=61472 RepID=A0A7R9F144_9NEOP|nr:unnamed protein product [Timema bartmani]
MASSFKGPKNIRSKTGLFRASRTLEALLVSPPTENSQVPSCPLDKSAGDVGGEDVVGGRVEDGRVGTGGVEDGGVGVELEG